MRWRLLLPLVLVGTLALAGGGAASTGHARASAEVLGPNLSAVSRDLNYAEDHEEDADDAFHEVGHFAQYYGDDQIRDALDHLDDALDDLTLAVTAGEIGVDEALPIANRIHNAINRDEDALDEIENGGTVDGALDALHAAEDEKAAAWGITNYGEALTAAVLGCTLNMNAIGGGDWFVGFDNCVKPVTKLLIDPGFKALRVSDAFIGSGSLITDHFPCAQTGWMISCTPPHPIVAPEFIFVDFGPVPTVVTPAEAIAVGADGSAQTASFTFGTEKATSDLGLSGTLFRVTPRGNQPPKKMGKAWNLGVGQNYGFDFSIADYSTVGATHVELSLDLPTGFKPLGVYPKDCTVGGSTLDCPLGTMTPTDASAVIVWGTFQTAGALTYRASVSSDANEPAQDTHSNAYSTDLRVFGVPNAVFGSVARSIRMGGRGMFTGRSTIGAKYEPTLERVTKVELGVLRLTDTGGKCQWMTRSGGFTASPLHIGGCDKGIWLPALGTSKWSFSLPKGLAPGRYEVLSRATNAAGITGSGFDTKLHNELLLTVKAKF